MDDIELEYPEYNQGVRVDYLCIRWDKDVKTVLESFGYRWPSPSTSDFVTLEVSDGEIREKRLWTTPLDTDFNEHRNHLEVTEQFYNKYCVSPTKKYYKFLKGLSV